jgi:hypothetical protein
VFSLYGYGCGGEVTAYSARAAAQPPFRHFQNVAVGVNPEHSGLRSCLKTTLGQGSRTRAQIKDVTSLRRYGIRRHLQHLFVVGNKGSDSRVILRELDSEMPRHTHLLRAPYRVLKHEVCHLISGIAVFCLGDPAGNRALYPWEHKS